MQIFPVSTGSTHRFLSARLLLRSCPLSPSHPRLPTHSHSWPHTAPPLLCRSSIQPSQPPTHSLGMNRSEELSCIIKCAKVLLNMTALDVEKFIYFFFLFPLEGSVQNAVPISKLLLGQMCSVRPVPPKLRVTNVLPFTCTSSRAV